MGSLGAVAAAVAPVTWKGLRHLDWILESVLIFMDRESGLGSRVSPGQSVSVQGCDQDFRVHRKPGRAWWASTKGVTAGAPRQGSGVSKAGRELKRGVLVRDL